METSNLIIKFVISFFILFLLLSIISEFISNWSVERAEYNEAYGWLTDCISPEKKFSKHCLFVKEKTEWWPSVSAIATTIMNSPLVLTGILGSIFSFFTSPFSFLAWPILIILAFIIINSLTNFVSDTLYLSMAKRTRKEYGKIKMKPEQKTILFDHQSQGVYQ